MFFLTDALCVYSTLDDAALMRSRSQVQRRQARGSASSALLWKPSARLRVHRRASSSRSRRRGPNRGDFDVGGGTSMGVSARSRRPPPSTDNVPTQDAADSGAAACARRREHFPGRPGVQAVSLGLNPEAGLNPKTLAGTQPGSGRQEERDSTRAPIRIKGRAARSESMLLMRRLQSIGRQPVPTKSERPEVEGATTKIKFND